MDTLVENETPLQLDDISPLGPHATSSLVSPHPAAVQLGAFFEKIGDNLREFQDTATMKIDGVYDFAS